MPRKATQTTESHPATNKPTFDLLDAKIHFYDFEIARMELLRTECVNQLIGLMRTGKTTTAGGGPIALEVIGGALPVKTRRKMSAAARKKIADAQRLRHEAAREAKGNSKTGKGKTLATTA